MAHAVSSRLGEPYPPSAGRRFGLTIGGAFLVFATVARWRGHPTTSAIFGTLGLAAVTGGVIVPAALGPVERAWMKLALVLSRVTTPVFMGVVYFGVLMPIGVARRRFFGSGLTHPVGAEGYWADRRASPRSDLFRQF